MDNWIVKKLADVTDSVQGIAVDSNNNIFITHGREGLWRYHTQNDSVIKKQLVIKRSQSSFKGVVCDDNNNFYICDSMKDTIMIYSILSGKIAPVESRTKFLHPTGITLDNNGNLFITDQYWIRRMNVLEGTCHKIAGSKWFFEPAHQDGEAQNAYFVEPQGIAISKDGTIYVCDRGNHCIRKIKDGIVSTIAGIPHASGCVDGYFSQAQFHFPTALLLLDNDTTLLVADNLCLRTVDLVHKKVITPTSFLAVKNPRSLALDRSGSILVGTPKNLMLIRHTWSLERFLWIGYVKENSQHCYLAQLPKELVMIIAKYIRER